MPNNQKIQNSDQFIECFTPFHWSFLISHGAYQPFTCIHSDGGYQKGNNYSLYDIEELVLSMSEKQNLLSFDTASKESRDYCFIHRWNDFTRQIIVFHTKNATKVNDLKLRQVLVRSDQYLTKKFIQYYNSYQTSGAQNGNNVFPTL